MRAREYQLLERCVDEGLQRGYRRAFKHTESPTEDALLDALQCNVLGEINEWFSFPPDEDCEQ